MWLTCNVIVSIARQHAYACRVRYCYGRSVHLSVRHTLVLYQNECTYRQTLSTIWQRHDTSFFITNADTKFQGEPNQQACQTRVGKFCDFRPKLPFVSETVRDRPMVAMDHKQEVTGIWSIRISSSDFERRDMGGQIFLVDLLITVWPRSTTFGMVTQVVEKHLSGVRHAHPKGWAAVPPPPKKKNWGTPAYAQRFDLEWWNLVR